MVAIQALSYLDDIKVRIVGGVGDEEYYRRLLQLAKKLEVEEKIEWRDEFVPEKELFQEFERADAVLLPYEDHTSMSGILSHCISWNIPTLMTDCGSFRDMVPINEAFLPERTGRDIAEKLEQLSSDMDEQTRMITAFAGLADNYSWENTAAKTAQVYRRAIQ
jgi:glycosyltransferase involved in cell wall biosynthesis